MALNPSNSSNLEQLALKGWCLTDESVWDEFWLRKSFASMRVELELEWLYLSSDWTADSTAMVASHCDRRCCLLSSQLKTAHSRLWSSLQQQTTVNYHSPRIIIIIILRLFSQLTIRNCYTTSCHAGRAQTTRITRPSTGECCHKRRKAVTSTATRPWLRSLTRNVS